MTAGKQVTIAYTITTEDTTGKSVSITGTASNEETQDLPAISYTTAESPVDVTRTVSTTEAAPGDQVTITTGITGVSGPLSATSTYEPQLSSATIQSVTVDDEPADPIISEATVNGNTVTLGDVGTDTTVTITEELTVGEELNVTHSITGSMTAGETTVEFEPVSVTVAEQQSVVDEFDNDGNGNIEITELGQAGQAFASGELSIVELGEIGAEFAS